MNHEEYKEMLALDVLDGLEEAERRALHAHLATCAACRETLEEMRDAAAALVHLVAPVAPPGELRARVLESVKALASGAPRLGDTSEPEESGSRAPRATEVSTVNVFPLAERRRRTLLMSQPAFAFGALAASLVIAVLAASLAVIWNRYNEMRAEVARLSARQNEAQEELAQEREARDLLAAPDVRLAVLSGTEAAPRARARLVFDPRTGRALLFAQDLPPAPAGKAYQLWFIARGQPLPGRVFNTDAAGQVTHRDQAPPQGLDAASFAVTLEQKEGVPAPTGDRYLLSVGS